MASEHLNSTEKSLSLGDVIKLKYGIHDYSSYSINYFPENVLTDCPRDQCSRWSVHSNNPPQYLTLKLKRPAFVQQIKFGKYEKTHVCNLKRFRVFGGLVEESMELLLEAGLKNDNQPETFNLRYFVEEDSEILPLLYIKIVPLVSWGPTFNFTIWYIELLGQDDPMYTSKSLKTYNMLREVEVVKLCLKHFRQQGYDAAFKALQEQTQVRLEDPRVSELYDLLVVNGDYEQVEHYMANCIEDGLVDSYLSRQDYKHSWAMQAPSSSVQPGNRGGHQLILDAKRRLIYLHGGWDGYQDLSDLWVYNMMNNSWVRLFAHVEEFNGPTPRSCHKMVFDSYSENIFILGRYLENSTRTTEYIKSDFYLYDTRARTWLQICDDTSQVGGPQLLYDHQMCIDTEKRTIYVFGGKIVTPRCVSALTPTNEVEYSGLFSYHIATNTWTQILVDCHHPSAAKEDVLSIKSRITHCMVFHNKNRKLYIYGGQRGKEDVDDFLSYDVDTHTMTVLNKDNRYGGGNKSEPSPGYTLRASIDCDRDEIYVFSSLSKPKDRRDPQQSDESNSFWVYSLQMRKWSRIYTCRHNPDHSAGATDKKASLDPSPRFAHQMVYDDVSKLHYLFGGNPGKMTVPQLRLDDFWTLILEKPKREEILNDCRYLLRKMRYEEIARTDKLKAMEYLRHHISEVVDHTNSKQLNNFHKLTYLLFKSEESDDDGLTTPPLGKFWGLEQINIAKDVALNPMLHSKAIDKISNLATASDEGINSDMSPKTDSEATNPTEDISLESCESVSSSSFTVASSDCHEHKSGGKRARHDYLYELKNRRAYLFNKLVKLMPEHMVQPERNLSDFAVV